MSFTYNDEGIRTSKTVNGVTHTYYLNGSQIMAEEWEDKLLVYLYDASGSPIGMMYRTTSYEIDEWNVFWFEKNLQGDIVAVYNRMGLELVTYSYDAWGNQTVKYWNGGGTSPAQYNPFRYRGYYYDTDLGMYYLQSRYYDSKICRFISPDHANVITATPAALTDKNLYAYCDNNPVMRVDESGKFWHIIAGAAIGAIINATVSAISQKITKGTINWVEVGVSAVAGALSGAIASTGIGAIGAGIINAAIDGTEYLVTQSINGVEINKSELAATMLFSGATAGAGFNGSKLQGIYKQSKTILETAVSPRKIALYTAKQKNVIKTVFKEIGTTILDGVVSIGYSWANHQYNLNPWR